MKKEVYIISTGRIVKGRTAGSQRVMNIARSLAAGNVTVFLCSPELIRSNEIEIGELEERIYFLRSNNGNNTRLQNPGRFIGAVSGFMKERKSEALIYLYPTVFVLLDFIYLAWFKFFKRYRLFCDINELRSTNAFPASVPDSRAGRLIISLKTIYNYLAYKLSELQVPFYDGIVVISSNLQTYFKKYTHRMIKIPILCDLSGVPAELPVLHYDNRTFRICFAGSINCRKEGFDLLFEALSAVNLNKEVELFLYGMILEKDSRELTRLADHFGLKNKVHYMGAVEPHELISEYAKYNLLIIPRPLMPQTKYGFSTKLSEYLLSGVPVLLTDVSDNAIYIRDGINGFIIPPGRADLLADKLFEIMDQYNRVAAGIAVNAIQAARDNFDYRLYSHDLIRFLFKTEYNSKSGNE